MAAAPAATWLTQEAFDRLQHELDELTGPRRSEIVKRIEAAREEGDLKENGGYHAAKDEQGKLEMRIRELGSLLKHAVVGEAPKSSGVVEVGTVISANVLGDPEKFLLGSRELAGDSGLDVYSGESPLGRAILGLKVGDESSYVAPSGKTIDVKILAVDTYTG